MTFSLPSPSSFLKLPIAAAKAATSIATKSLLTTVIDGVFSAKRFHCWIACDVMAAMLVVKNNSLPLRWEKHFICMQSLRKKLYCIDHQHGRLVTWVKSKNGDNTS